MAMGKGLGQRICDFGLTNAPARGIPRLMSVRSGQKDKLGARVVHVIYRCRKMLFACVSSVPEKKDAQDET